MERVFTVDDWHIRSDDDGRTVDGRIVPYMQPTQVTEYDANGALVTYREQFMPRSCLFMAQTAERRRNAGWISLQLDHSETPSLDSRIGYATTLEDRDDGAYATFRLYASRDLDKIVSMLDESHRGLSVHFADRKPPRIIDDIVSRVQVHIDHVAATPTPAYANAGIVAMREAMQIEPATPNLDEIRQWLDTMRKAPA